MNCLEFRRAALADPRRLAADAAAHVGECPACREFLARSLELEARLAAAIALALGWPRSDAMALAGIDFVVYDEAQSIVDATPTDLRVLARVARDMGVSLPGELGDIRYVCVYPFIAGAAHHLLVKSSLGKVTLLLIPKRPAAARAAGSAYGLKAAVLPARTGSIVIIGESSRSVGRVETLLKSG